MSKENVGSRTGDRTGTKNKSHKHSQGHTQGARARGLKPHKGTKGTKKFWFNTLPPEAQNAIVEVAFLSATGESLDDLIVAS